MTVSRWSPRTVATLVVAGVAWASIIGLVAGPAAALTVEGRVLRGEARDPTAGVSVSLHVVRGEEELPGQTVASDARGLFRFAGLRADPSLSYFLSTEYQGAFYTEGPLEVAGKDAATHDLVVYDVGRDIASVRVANHHIIVERNPDHLHVTEVLVVENRGTTAYLGTGHDHAENAGIRLGLPASVKEFQTGMGGDAQTVRVQGRDLSSLRPIPPGQKPFSFSYHVPLSGRMDLSHRIYFPTDRFVVLLSDPSLRLKSTSLTYTGPRDQGGKKFEIYEGSNFPVGSEVTMSIEGAGFWSNPAVYPWLAAPLVIAAVLVFARRRGRSAVGAKPGAPAKPGAAPASVPAVGPATKIPAVGAAPTAPAAPAARAADDDFATVYLFLIDALDRGLERGEISREAHGLVRANLKRRLEAIVSDVSRAGGVR